MKKGMWIVVGIIVLVIVVIMVRSRGTTPAGTDTPTSTEQTPVVTEQVPTTVKEFTVTGANFSFTPSTMTVKKGDTVKITFVNSGGFHDLKIDEFAVATKKLSAGAQEVVEFVADKAGTFEYYCSVGDHRAMGMKGTLTVTE
jgi:plastocyanin